MPNTKVEKVAPVVKTTGGRYYTASKIVKLFPPRGSYLTYLEPMVRSGAVLFAHDPTDKNEVINDYDSRWTNFYRVLQNETLFAQFQRKIEAINVSGVEFNHALTHWRMTSPMSHEKIPYEARVQLAVDLYVTANMSFGGGQETFSPVTKNRLRRGMNEQVSAWLGKNERLRRVYQRMNRVLVLPPGDVFELLPEYDRKDVVQYIDPPWLIEEDNPDTRATAGLYGSFDWDRSMHERFLELLVGQHNARILLSGFQSKLYKDVLVKEHGWKEHTFDVSLHAAGGDSKRRQKEMLWTNY